jgi:hypothetical protein
LGYRKLGGIEINDKKNENFDIRGKFAGKSFDKRIFQTAIKGVLEILVRLWLLCSEKRLMMLNSGRKRTVRDLPKGRK